MDRVFGLRAGTSTGRLGRTILSDPDAIGLLATASAASTPVTPVTLELPEEQGGGAGACPASPLSQLTRGVQQAEAILAHAAAVAGAAAAEAHPSTGGTSSGGSGISRHAPATPSLLDSRVHQRCFSGASAGAAAATGGGGESPLMLPVNLEAFAAGDAVEEGVLREFIDARGTADAAGASRPTATTTTGGRRRGIGPEVDDTSASNLYNGHHDPDTAVLFGGLLPPLHQQMSPPHLSGLRKASAAESAGSAGSASPSFKPSLLTRLKGSVGGGGRRILTSHAPLLEQTEEAGVAPGTTTTRRPARGGGGGLRGALGPSHAAHMAAIHARSPAPHTSGSSTTFLLRPGSVAAQAAAGRSHSDGPLCGRWPGRSHSESGTRGTDVKRRAPVRPVAEAAADARASIDALAAQLGAARGMLHSGGSAEPAAGRGR